VERRRAARRPVAAGEPLARAKLRTGGQLQLLDASSSGALVQTTERLLPGRHLDVHVISAHGRVLVRVRVARAFVFHLAADCVEYHAALAFDQALDVRAEGYAVPVAIAVDEKGEGTRYPNTDATGDIEFTERPSA
jgi:hypothetical protein